MWKKIHYKKEKNVFFLRFGGKNIYPRQETETMLRRLKCLNYLYLYFLFIQVYQLLNQFQISYINPLQVPDWLKHFHTHSWFLHYTLNIINLIFILYISMTLLLLRQKSHIKIQTTQKPTLSRVVSAQAYKQPRLSSRLLTLYQDAAHRRPTRNSPSCLQDKHQASSYILQHIFLTKFWFKNHNWEHVN